MDKGEKERRKSLLIDCLCRQNGLIAHSGSLYDGGKVFLFGGKGKTGKSTIVKKLKYIMSPINDDMNILKFSSEENNKIEVFTLFPNKKNPGFHYVVNEDISGNLKAILFPVKEYEKDSYLEPLKDNGIIWKTLLSFIAPPITGEDHLFPNYYEMIDRLMDSVPFFNIYHNLKDSPEFIAELLRSIK